MGTFQPDLLRYDFDPGVLTDTNGAYYTGFAATNVWQFSTKPGGPVNPTSLMVAADGSEDFVTVQGAVDSIPLNNNTYTVVNVKNGNYVEIVDVSSKSNLTFYGQSRTGAVVGYPNNNTLTGTTCRAAWRSRSMPATSSWKT